MRPPPAHETYQLADLSEAPLTIVAKSIALEPEKQLQLRGATFYLDGQKSLYFPFHVISIGQKTLFADQAFGISSEGPTVNFPFYPYVQPNAITTLHLRHGAPIGASAYAVRPGWNVDLSETYNGPHNAEGSLDVYGLTRSGWNAQFRHGQRLDPTTTGSLFLDLSQLSSAFLTSQLTRNYPHFQLNATASGERASSAVDPLTGDKGQATGDIHGQLNAQTYSRPVLGVKQLLYTFSTDVSRQGYYGGDAAVQQGTVITEGMGSRVFTTPLPIAPATTVTQSVNVGQMWVQGKVATLSGVPVSGISTQSQTSLNRQLNHLGSTSLSYEYTQTPQILTSGITTQTTGTGHQRLGFGLNLNKGDLWNFSLTGSRGLDVDQATIFANASYHIVGPWRASVVINDDTIEGTHYRDLEYRLTRHLSSLQRDFSIFYSTTAKRVQVDLSAIGF